MIQLRDHRARKKPLAGFLLAVYWKDYNGRHVASTEIEEIAKNPCQALFPIFR
jgi:hypothetical protein